MLFLVKDGCHVSFYIVNGSHLGWSVRLSDTILTRPRKAHSIHVCLNFAHGFKRRKLKPKKNYGG
jgi:endonuclease IV